MGGLEKKVKINQKELKINEIKFDKNPLCEEIGHFLEDFLSDKSTFELKTSGSTGTPKIIALDKQAMRASAQATLSFLNLKKGDTALICLSPTYIAGVMMLVRWLEGDLHLITNSVSSTPLKDIDHTIDFAALVPFQAEASLNDLHKVKKLILGGAPISKETETRLLGIDSDIYHTYGMTETISHIAMRKLGESAFKALPDVTLAVDERECLNITAPKIEVHHLQTNDVVQLISNTEFVWQGRADFVINSGGIKFHPEQVEHKINIPDRAFFVAGVTDERLGEKMVLLIEGAEEKLPETAFVALGKYEKPKEIYFVPSFERTNSGKINRNQTLAQNERIFAQSGNQ